MEDVDENRERKKRLANLKRELQNKAKRKRKQLLQGANIRKTSVDRSLEKSFLSKSELSVANSIARRQILLSLNSNLARQVQQLKESAKEMKDKLNGSEINFCELAFKYNRQKQIVETLELEVESLKAKCGKYESWKKSSANKLKEMFTMFNDSRVVNDRESVSLQDLDLLESETAEPEKNLDDNVEDSSGKLREICQENVDDKRPLQLGKTDFRALFDMTAITEEDGFTPNVTMNEYCINNFDVNHISSSDEGEVLEEEVCKSRRDTFIVTKSLQIEALPTPVKSKNVRRSKCFNTTLKNAASSESNLPLNLSEVASAAIDLNNTKLGAENIEPTTALNKSAKKVIDQTSTTCVQNESSIPCSANFIDCLAVASDNRTSLPSPTPCSTNNDHDLNCCNQRPAFDRSEPRILPCVQTKSPVPIYSTNCVDNHNGSIDCQIVASSTLTFPIPTCSTNNHDIDDRIQRQSVTASICNNHEASSQESSLMVDHNNRRSSLRRNRSVTSENTIIVKQAKLKKTNKQNKNGKLENEDSNSKIENTKLKKQKQVQQLKSKELSEGISASPEINTTNFDAEDMELTETLNNLIIIEDLPANNSAKKAIDQTSSQSFQTESQTTCLTNSIDVRTVASFNPTSLPFTTTCSINDSHNLHGNNHCPEVASSEPILLQSVQTKSPVPSCSTNDSSYNDSIDCLTIASSEPPYPIASCSSNNDNLDNLIHCQSVTASVCSNNNEASSQVTSLITEHSNRKSSLRQCTSVTNENITVARQTKMKINKQHKDKKPEIEEVKSKSQNTKLKRHGQRHNQQLENDELSEESSTSIDLNKNNPTIVSEFPANKSAKKVINQTSSTQCSTNSIDCLIVASSKPTSLAYPTFCSKINSNDLNGSEQHPTVASSEPNSLTSALNEFPTLSCSTDDRNHCQSAPICSNIEEASSLASSLVTDQRKRMSSLKENSSVTRETAIVANQVKLKSTKQQNKNDKLENEASTSKTQQTKLKEANKDQQLENVEDENRLSQKIANRKKSVKRIKSLSENLNLMNVNAVNGNDKSEYCKISQTEHSSSSSKKKSNADDYLKTVENDVNDVRRPRRDCKKTTYKEPSLIKKLRRPY